MCTTREFDVGGVQSIVLCICIKHDIMMQNKGWNVMVLQFLAMGIPHHNITDKRKELHIPEDLMVREGRYITEDMSSGCARSFSLSLATRERSGCAFQAVHLHQVGLSVSESLSLSLSLSLFRSLSFHLIYYPYFQLDCIISCHLAFQHRSQ